jgi:hypothetical protein
MDFTVCATAERLTNLNVGTDDNSLFRALGECVTGFRFVLGDRYRRKGYRNEQQREVS